MARKNIGCDDGGKCRSDNGQPRPESKGLFGDIHENVSRMMADINAAPAAALRAMGLLPLNAVERVLSRAIETVELFDRLLGPLRELKGNTREVCSLCEAIGRYAHCRYFAKNEQADGPPRLRGVLTPERLGLMERWECDNAVAIAADSVVVAEAEHGRRHGNGADLSAQGIEAYCDILARREALLDGKTWIALVKDVWSESEAWGSSADRVATLAENVRLAVQPLWQLEPKGESSRTVQQRREAWNAARAPLQAAIEALSTVPKPREAKVPPSPTGATIEAGPTVAVPTPGKAAKPAAKKPAGSRKGIGGRKKKYPDRFIRDVMETHERDSRRAIRKGLSMPPIYQWLADYCSERDMRTDKTFSRKPDDTWPVTARRFWKAATKRYADMIGH